MRRLALLAASALITVVAPATAQDADLKRGGSLVSDSGCGNCHTPQTADGDPRPGEDLKGFATGGWLAPDITGDPVTGVGSWTAAEIAEYLKTGANRFDVASGMMALVVESTTSKWSDADLGSVAAYLKSLRPASGGQDPTPVAADDRSMVAGKAIYEDRCSGCHISSGEGAKGLFPKLAKGPLVVNGDPTSLIHVVLAGSRAGATAAAPTAPAMPSFGWNLDDEDVANVLTYVRNAWGNAASAVKPEDVAALRKSLAPN